MYLSVISPVGTATSIDLAQMAVWRLELRAMQVPGNETGTPTKGLALGVGYASNGTLGFAAVALLDCKVTGDDLLPIIGVGLPRYDRTGNKERLREALKVLVNTMSGKEADEIGAKSARLVDIYHDILEGMWGFQGSLNAVTAATKGEFDGWRWALTKDRFDGWLTKADAGEAIGLGTAPGARRTTDVNSPPPMASMSMAPPPSAQAQAQAATVGAELAQSDPLGPAPGSEKPKKGKKGAVAASIVPPTVASDEDLA